MNKPNLVIVVPCYNEEEVLSECAKRLGAVVAEMVAKAQIAEESSILFVDDGSRDKTWAGIERLHREAPGLFTGVRFAGNRGHQYAVMAGLMTARTYADVTISIDADLQDDVGVIPEMIEKYRAGAEIVYGVRKKRDTDTFFKRTTARGFYTLMQSMGVKTIYDHADYRLMGKLALDALAEYPEGNLFLRGLVPLLGYTTEKVYYDRTERFAGESKYPLKKMIMLAVDGITSLSAVPIRLVGKTGIVMTGLSLLGILAALISLIFGKVISGTVAILLGMALCTGLILCALGILGTYIGKTYLQSKQRPRYRIAQALLPEDS